MKGNAECLFSFGSKVDILGIILWILAGFSIMGHYPDPKLRKAAIDDVEAADEMANLQPKQLMLPGQMWQGGDLSARQTANQTASFAWEMNCPKEQRTNCSHKHEIKFKFLY